MIDTALLLNARVIESGAADNALATATATAILAARHFIRGLGVTWSAAPTAAYKTIQVKFGTTVILNIIFDPLKDGESGRMIPLPSVIHGDFNQAVSAELSASGTGGVTGRVQLFVASI